LDILLSVLDVDLSGSYTSWARFSNRFCNGIATVNQTSKFCVFLFHCMDGLRTHEAFFLGYYLLSGISYPIYLYSYYLFHSLSGYSLKNLVLLYLRKNPLVKFIKYKIYCWFASLFVDYLNCQYKHYLFHLAVQLIS